MSIDLARLAEVEQKHLAAGGHDPGDAMCVMEAVAYVAGEPWSDHPACASKVIAAFCRAWNDGLSDEDRDRLLRPLVSRLVGTAASDEVEERRSWLAVDWLIRVHLTTWLRLAGLDDAAARLEGADEITSVSGLAAVQPALAAARDAAWDAAWDAARDAARDVAWAVAWAAAGAAARDAARDVARDAARVAARVAARDAAGDAARAAARVAARVAARDAAGDAARDAAGVAAWDAAGDAARVAAGDVAWVALAPTVAVLQESALDLLDRMIAVGDR